LQVLLKAVVVFSWVRQLPNLGRLIVSSYPAWMIKPVDLNSRNQASLLWDQKFFCWEFYSRSLIWNQILWCSDHSHQHCVLCSGGLRVAQFTNILGCRLSASIVHSFLSLSKIYIML
jgi:hypothetical protein